MYKLGAVEEQEQVEIQPIWFLSQGLVVLYRLRLVWTDGPWTLKQHADSTGVSNLSLLICRSWLCIVFTQLLPDLVIVAQWKKRTLGSLKFNAPSKTYMALRPLFYDAIYKGEIRTLKCQIQFFNSQVPYLRSLGFFLHFCRNCIFSCFKTSWFWLGLLHEMSVTPTRFTGSQSLCRSWCWKTCRMEMCAWVVPSEGLLATQTKVR